VVKIGNPFRLIGRGRRGIVNRVQNLPPQLAETFVPTARYLLENAHHVADGSAQVIPPVEWR